MPIYSPFLSPVASEVSNVTDYVISQYLEIQLNFPAS